jgi:glycosyltransferase involved in cell wall biosynthesis
MGLRNVFACLVHEKQECVIDLVRNLSCLDPESQILLYNGGKNPDLLRRHFPFDRYPVIIHPRPRPMAWGKLHGFALDCMQFVRENHAFDTLTIVDSDQLAARPGYSDYLSRFLADHDNVGLLGCSEHPQPSGTAVGPAAAAYREIELWRPFLRQFKDGEKKFVHWTFWPSTVFTAEAVRELGQLFKRDAQLADIIQRTRIWATEEILFPTLVALLGFKIAINPCSYEYVKYGESYSTGQITQALGKSDVYWVHPVPRQYGHPVRQHIRTRFNHYTKTSDRFPSLAAGGAKPSYLLKRKPILDQMQNIKGWLEEDEAELLIGATSYVLDELAQPHAVVEVGSYCGRATVVLGSVFKALNPAGKVFAIDPHLGRVGALDQGIKGGVSTLKIFRRNMIEADLKTVVQEIRQHSFEVDWNQPIGLLLVDGLHDYINVARDFYHFESWVVPGGLIAFHDYADYYPGVVAFVNEILGSGRYRKVEQAGSMIVLERLPEQTQRESPDAVSAAAAIPKATAPAERKESAPAGAMTDAGVDDRPLVSCIMPTADRRSFVCQAIHYFRQQDYQPRELIIVDTGNDPVADLVPRDPAIRYIRLDGKISLGGKRNAACQAARGDIIVHWDDDDWMADWRLSYQVQKLLEDRADICGLDHLMFYEPASGRAWRYYYPRQKQTPLLAGGSLCYLKRFWKDQPFAEINIGEDAQFIWSKRPKKLLALDDNTFYVAVVHSNNTNPINPKSKRWRRLRTVKIRGLMGENWSFYQIHSTAGKKTGRTFRRSSKAPIEVVNSTPLISCIMPTFKRRLFLPQAITYFRRQTYPNTELVIVDDGPDMPADLIPSDDRIHYIRLDKQVTVGHKRNIAVQRSNGEFIAHWDDDDWYSPDRLQHQIQAMQTGGDQVCGFDTGIFFDVFENTYWSCSPELHARMFFADVNGRSILYAKRLWEKLARYPDMALAEDAHFLRNLSKRNVKITKLENDEKLIYIRHRNNTWHFECGRFMDPAGWRQLQIPNFMLPEDLTFYKGIRKEIRLAA